MDFLSAGLVEAEIYLYLGCSSLAAAHCDASFAVDDVVEAYQNARSRALYTMSIVGVKTVVTDFRLREAVFDVDASSKVGFESTIHHSEHLKVESLGKYAVLVLIEHAIFD